ncbi:CobW family GTP-binding protein [Chromohalobacter sarecensis]|uniref:CobW family GTP-binding protein n=1 Tax=Chromohalobacter sarecensis TaxID=245294 RepID=A0ABV9CYW9_9GAMM|nr:GTP-binding protein [Chromohalobacter sarecensis]MCK0713659.1 GTP-binding protein [Chromohalobacter sarecensis]
MSTSILPIPTTLLCGFLGSGKTTRINTLIASGELTNALFLVNDFGRINIDAELIESQEDHILRLTNGCACCGIAGNLSAQLRDIRRWPTPPSHLIFEASGIARPRPLMQLLDAARGFRLESAETLVDASAFTRHYKDTAIKDIVVSQIREVAHLRINRINWLTDAQREQVLQSIAALNPTAGRTLEKAEKPPSASTADSATRGSGTLVTESVEFASVIDLAALEALLSEAATTLVRAKGLVQANDHSGRYHVIQLAGGRLTWTVTRAHQSRALVVIGYPGKDMDHLIASLRAL